MKHEIKRPLLYFVILLVKIGRKFYGKMEWNGRWTFVPFPFSLAPFWPQPNRQAMALSTVLCRLAATEIEEKRKEGGGWMECGIGIIKGRKEGREQQK
jgi:hypothetical protein